MHVPATNRHARAIARGLILATTALALALTLASANAMVDDTHVDTVEDAWSNAQAKFAAGKYRQAFTNYFWAAIRDHSQAQEMVGIMYSLGPKLFGTDVVRDRKEADF